MRSQAERVVVWEERNELGSSIIYLRNTSDAPIFRLLLVESKPQGKLTSRLKSAHEADEVEPKGSVSKKIEKRGSGAVRVRFTGPDGRVWERDVNSGKLTKASNRFHLWSP
jgi:hypothetical protein